MKEIVNISDFTRFHGLVFSVVAKYGLQREAKDEDLLSGDEWNDPVCKNMLMDKIARFFDTHIK